MRKGAALVEVVLAVGVIAMAATAIFVSIVSEPALSSYTLSKLSVESLAVSKMNEIEGKLRSNPDYYAPNTYYGFQWDPGSANDINRDPRKGYTSDTGTFYKDGYPEYRYQFYITFDGNGRFIHLLVWRRPKTSSDVILKTYLYEEVYAY